jgi:hypothetical protein
MFVKKMKPSENLGIYDKFIVRTKNLKINIAFIDYDLALMFYCELISQPDKLNSDSVTLEGNVKNKKVLHTIWYTHEGEQKPFQYYTT